MQILLVTDTPEQWSFLPEPVRIVDAYEYLTQAGGGVARNEQTVRVFNLCSSYKYQTIGYYVSLLAQARAHKVLPTPLNIEDVLKPELTDIIYEELEEEIQHVFKKLKSKEFTLSIYFGHNIAEKYHEISRKIHSLVPFSMFRVFFKHDKSWYIKRIKPINIGQVPEAHMDFLKEVSKKYFTKKRFHGYKDKKYLYELAILYRKNEENSPSNEKAIRKFIEAGDEVRLNVSLISDNDIKYLPQYDALFIRETTGVNHYTYNFSRKALSENMVVVDDPLSILRCCNKVYLNELLKEHKILCPKTIIITKHNYHDYVKAIKYPIILKKPDSEFSIGVVKANTGKEYLELTKALLANSDLIIAQEYMPTEFDWRIGIMSGEPIYANKYYMASGHWQIRNWAKEGKDEYEGDDVAVPLEEVPKDVLKTAVNSAKLIGDGLYGVDIKEVNHKAHVIEINDNPNIDAGIEDRVEGDALYEKIMRLFLAKIKAKHQYG